MKTIWINDITGVDYDDYDEAVDNVLEYAQYIEEDIIWEVINEQSPHEILHAMLNLEKGSCLYAKIMTEVNQRILSEYLIEKEVPDEEDDEEDETNENF